MLVLLVAPLIYSYMPDLLLFVLDLLVFARSEHVNFSAVAMASSTPSSSQVPASQASGTIVAAGGTTGTTEENVGHISDGEEEAAAAPRKKRKQYSKVWNDFTQVWKKQTQMNFVHDFLKFAGIRACPRVCGYPRIAGMGFVFYPSRVAGAGAGTGLGLRVRVCGVSIRADFTRCHL